jgi:hypothetical protein
MNTKFLAQATLTVAALALFPSCAILRYKCNREYAAKKGMDDAVNGRTAMPGRLEGNSCDGDYSASDYSKDYNYGFQQKKNEICMPATAATWGRADGEAGAEAKPQKGKLGMCEDNRLYVLYDNEFKKAFCAPARAKTLGAARANTWQPADFETSFNACGKGNKVLRTAYMQGFNDTVANLCTLDNAKKSGDGEANARHAPDAMRGHFQTCANKDDLLPAFDAAFAAKKAAIDKADADAAAAAAAAARQRQVDEFLRTTATAYFPFQLRSYTSRCNVSGDRSYVSIEVENRYPEQVTIQGNWKVIYYNNDFAKITEDRDVEAVLVTGNNRKTFQKMTLPKDAAFCRAEFLGAALQ